MRQFFWDRPGDDYYANAAARGTTVDFSDGTARLRSPGCEDLLLDVSYSLGEDGPIEWVSPVAALDLSCDPTATADAADALTQLTRASWFSIDDETLQLEDEPMVATALFEAE